MFKTLFKIIFISCILFSVFGCTQETDDKTVQMMVLSRSVNMNSKEDAGEIPEVRYIEIEARYIKDGKSVEFPAKEFMFSELGFGTVNQDGSYNWMPDSFHLSGKNRKSIVRFYKDWKFLYYNYKFLDEKMENVFTCKEVFDVKETTTKIVMTFTSMNDYTYEEY